VLADNPESEAPAVQDTPTENPAETQPTEDGAEQPDGAFAYLSMRLYTYAL
jgi:hypothetical protein